MVCCGALAACGSSGSTPSTGSTQHSTAATIKVITTPKFAPPASSEAARSGTVQVAYRNITIRPDTLRVKVGTTVRWTNFDPILHNVTSVSGPQALRSGELGAGRSFSVTLTRPGTIHYECTNHPATMNGTIEVLR